MKMTAVLAAALILFPAVLAGCGDAAVPKPETEKPFAAIKQHDTRVVVVCKGSQGQYYTKSLHKSERVTCDNLTFRLEDFGKICEDHYVAFPGQEKELEKYLHAAALEKK